MVRVGVLAYPGCFGAEIFGITDLLLIANQVATAAGIAPGPLFDVSVVAASTEPVVTAGGFPVLATPWGTAHGGAGPDVLVVPGFEFLPAGDLDPLLGTWHREIGFVAATAADGVPVASVCIGALLLGAAGLLDGRAATTSWLFAGHLARRHPDCEVQPDSILVTDRGVTTTAGFSAVHDLAMSIIRDHAGETVARRTARVTLVADNRTSQSPYVDPVMVTADTPSFSRDVQRWLAAHLAEPYDLTVLSAAFSVSTRTMLRRFGTETGRSPLDFLQSTRVDRAKRLLESPGASVAQVMERVGYRDAGAFRRLFSEQVGVTPSAYRRQFRTPTMSGARS